MSELSGQVGELAMTIEITRAATGKTETHHLVGILTAAAEEEESHAARYPEGGINHNCRTAQTNADAYRKLASKIGKE